MFPILLQFYLLLFSKAMKKVNLQFYDYYIYILPSQTLKERGGGRSAASLLRTCIPHSHATSFQRSPVIKYEQEFNEVFVTTLNKLT